MGKLKGQGHKIRFVCTHGSLVTRNTNITYQTLAFTVQKIFARVKFQTELQSDKQDKNNLPRIFDLGGTGI